MKYISRLYDATFVVELKGNANHDLVVLCEGASMQEAIEDAMHVADGLFRNNPDVTGYRISALVEIANNNPNG